MSLSQRLLEEQKKVMKAQDKLRLNLIRGLRSELKYAEIAKKEPLCEEEEQAVLLREVKRRKEALADYERANRPSLLQELKAEIEILASYLPEQLDEGEIEALVRQAIDQVGAVSKKDMGKVMKVLMPGIRGKADGSLVKTIVDNLLG
jgi:uncharacterized protein